MATIQEKISALVPEATFSESGQLYVTVPDAQWHKLAKALHDDKESPYDYLIAIVGADWGETLGCVYYLESTSTAQRLAVIVQTADREKPMLHSVCDLWQSANLYEREVYDFYGIVFINHPDMRRLFLRKDWVGYPLRKDYNADPALNPIRLENEESERRRYTRRATTRHLHTRTICSKHRSATPRHTRCIAPAYIARRRDSYQD